jgi:hypothetical protein
MKERETRRIAALLSLVSHVDEMGEQIIAHEVGRLRVIRAKRDGARALTMDDIDYLLAEVKKGA